MIEIKGKYNTAKVWTNEIEETARLQIANFLDHEAFKGGNISIMPDVHAGAGAVIGFTAELGDKVIPNVIGVDIGCGVTSWSLPGEPDFEKLDKIIREKVPFGFEVNEKRSTDLIISIVDLLDGKPVSFIKNVIRICQDQGQGEDRVMKSIGSLGGGNHFIEVDMFKDKYWLTIHSGSRNFGLKIANWHQKKASRLLRNGPDKEKIKEIVAKYKNHPDRGELIQREIKELNGAPDPSKGLEYLEDVDAVDYIEDMKIAQMYARVNRRVMAHRIFADLCNVDSRDMDCIESVHNYIDFEDGIIRKGAISAKKDERVIIPLNMADGIIVGCGKGNKEWNNSAPHGAGRTMSRRVAKGSIKLDDFKKRMIGVWSSCVQKSTLDEAPQAYKKAEDIIGYLEPTVEIEMLMKPVYNFKAS